ncbi:MAG: type II secretion system protein [Candidatus Heimdallarchaeota archaeon]
MIRDCWEQGKDKNSFLTQIKDHKGFTLIEVLIMVAIIIILTGIALVQLQNALNKARVNKAEAEIEMMGRAIEQIEEDTGNYLESLDQLDDPTYPDESFSPWWGPYVSSLPVENKDPWGNDYLYVHWIDGGNYWYLGHWPPGWGHGRAVGFVDLNGDEIDNDGDGETDEGDERMPRGLYNLIQSLLQEQSTQTGFNLRSTGSDGEEGTEDDIVYGTY